MDLRAILMGLAFALMWSSAFTSARIIVADASPLFSLALRFLISGLIGVAIARAMGQSWRLTRRQWHATILFGVCQNALYLGLNFIAMQTVQASLAAIIASTMPLLVALASRLVLGERLKPLGALGLFAGFLGVALIMGSRIGAGVDLYGVALCGIGVLALTFATMAVRGATSGGNFLMVVGLQMLVGSAILRIAGEVRAKIEAGEDVLNLTVGDFASSEFPIPDMLRDGVTTALAEGHSNYPPATGVMACREAVRDLYARRLGLEYPVESVLLAGGARPFIAGAYLALVNPGDKVVYPVPSWNSNS